MLLIGMIAFSMDVLDVKLVCRPRDDLLMYDDLSVANFRHGGYSLSYQHCGYQQCGRNSKFSATLTSEILRALCS